jgi:hypothetical protein
MSNNDNGGHATIRSSVNDAMETIKKRSAYGVHYYIFSAIVALCAAVVNYVTNASLPSFFFCWVVAIIGAFACIALFGLAILDLIPSIIKKKQKSEQEQQASAQAPEAS